MRRRRGPLAAQERVRQLGKGMGGVALLPHTAPVGFAQCTECAGACLRLGCAATVVDLRPAPSLAQHRQEAYVELRPAARGANARGLHASQTHPERALVLLPARAHGDALKLLDSVRRTAICHLVRPRTHANRSQPPGVHTTGRVSRKGRLAAHTPIAQRSCAAHAPRAVRDKYKMDAGETLSSLVRLKTLARLGRTGRRR